MRSGSLGWAVDSIYRTEFEAQTGIRHKAMIPEDQAGASEFGARVDHLYWFLNVSR